MEWGQQMKLHQNNAKLAMYQNNNYSYERINEKRLILDVNMSISGTLDEVQCKERCIDGLTKFKLKLCEPLIIDELSDVYLESFMTWNNFLDNSGSGSCLAYVLKVKEFCNNDTNYGTNIYTTNLIPNPDYNCNISCSPVNVSQIIKTTYDCCKTDGIIIPHFRCFPYDNDQQISTSKTMVCYTHLSDAEKYVATINPTKLTEINGTLTDNGVIKNTECGFIIKGGSNIEYNSVFKNGYGRFIASFLIRKRCYC
jgi:hypothetical protein